MAHYLFMRMRLHSDVYSPFPIIIFLRIFTMMNNSLYHHCRNHGYRSSDGQACIQKYKQTPNNITSMLYGRTFIAM